MMYTCPHNTHSNAMTRKKTSTIEEEDADLHMKQMIGQRIQRARDRMNKSAETVSKKIGISRSALTQIETGRNNVSAVMLWKIAAALHCNINDFFPSVPESVSLREADTAVIDKQDIEAGKFFREAYKMDTK